MSAETITRETLEADLAQFCGSETVYKHWLGLIYTDGVKYLAEKAGAYWLIDLVASHQRGKLRQEPFQVWTLTVNLKKQTARAECRADSDTPILKAQNIEYTDFPLPSIKLWLVDGVLMLPSEY